MTAPVLVLVAIAAIMLSTPFGWRSDPTTWRVLACTCAGIIASVVLLMIFADAFSSAWFTAIGTVLVVLSAVVTFAGKQKATHGTS